MTIERNLLTFYERTAPRYARDIEPVFALLARGVIEYADIRREERVLDLGTGSGLVARHAAQVSDFVTGLDFSPGMLQVARNLNGHSLIRGDMHALGLRTGTFDVALAMFAFNSTDPSRSLPEVYRILAPWGRLVMQEWRTVDPLTEIVANTLFEYALDDPPPALAALREAFDSPTPWDSLENSVDIDHALHAVGFGQIQIDVVTPSIPIADLDTFINYKLAWASRQAEMEAMPRERRELFFGELRERLEMHLTPNGFLIWEPNLVRGCAGKR